VSKRSEVVYVNGAPSTPIDWCCFYYFLRNSYLLALLRERLHVPRGLTEIAEAKQVRKTNQSGILYQFKKRVRKSILTFRTQNLVDFFFEGFRSNLKRLIVGKKIQTHTSFDTTLDLEPYMTPGHSPSHDMKLVGIISHHGTKDNEHYTAMTRREDKWTLYNDAITTQTTMEHIHQT